MICHLPAPARAMTLQNLGSHAFRTTDQAIRSKSIFGPTANNASTHLEGINNSLWYRRVGGRFLELFQRDANNILPRVESASHARLHPHIHGNLPQRLPPENCNLSINTACRCIHSRGTERTQSFGEGLLVGQELDVAHHPAREIIVSALDEELDAFEVQGDVFLLLSSYICRRLDALAGARCSY